MDELKRSLEEAIKELQELPAAAPANPLPKTTTASPNGKKTILEQALAAGPVVTTVAGLGRELVLPLTPAPRIEKTVSAPRAPAANTIEAALAAAPAVSPHYVPPPTEVPAPREAAPVPIPAPREVAPVPAPARHEMATAPVATSREVGSASYEATLPAPLPPAARIKRPATVAENLPVQKSGHEQERTTAVLARPAPQHLDIPAARTATIPAPAQNIEEPEKRVELAEQAKKLRDKVWRWATIGISCAGGLASGWLGSSFSDQANGILQSGVQAVADKASAKMGIKPPVKVVSAGKAVGSANHVTGKTDRAVPIDENHCTVLERDRGTGLTLAKPCKLIETAGFTSTLDKSDLLVKPR